MESLPHIQKPPKTEGDWFSALICLARYLRTPDGCPWDRQQTTLDFARFSREEGDELVQAISDSDNEEIAEEWGDCLFTLLAAAAAAEEEGRFRVMDALKASHEKMVRRHDHVFGETRAATAEGAIESWNRIKAEEKARRRK